MGLALWVIGGNLLSLVLICSFFGFDERAKMYLVYYSIAKCIVPWIFECVCAQLVLRIK